MHLMIDLETLSTSPQAAILSIGAVLFDPMGSYIPAPPGEGPSDRRLSLNVDIDSCIRAGLKIDGDTLRWWFNQGSEARKALITDPVQIEIALNELKAFYLVYHPERVWATEDFDLPILANAYREVLHQSTPWKFFHDRGLRTLKEIAYPALNGKMPPAKAPAGFVAHSAVWDAYVQALDVQTCYKQLGLAQ